MKVPDFVLSFTYQKALISLPKTIQNKTVKTVEKICTAETMKDIQNDQGLNFEPIQSTNKRKTRAYSVRVDEAHRLILLRGPDKSPFYISFAGKHDEAYKWAINHDLVIHPKTGSLQLLVIPETAEEEPKAKGPLANIRDFHWRRIGLRPDLRRRVLFFKRVEDAQVLEGIVSRDTLEAIQYLLVGCSLEEVLNNTPLFPVNWDEPPLLFEGVLKDDLLDLGVPENSLDRVYSLKSEEDLELVQAELPTEAYEGLCFLNWGFGVEEIIKEYGRVRGNKVDTDNYKKALDNPDSRRNHVLVPKGKEISKFLEGTLEAWRIFLHQKQRKQVEINWSGPALVLGGAGTGKTVVAMHRAKWLAENVCRNGEKIFFTTFNVNLAQDIRNNMENLCPNDTRNRIVVESIDRWVTTYLKQKGFGPNIEYWSEMGIQVKNCWERALQAVPFAQSMDWEKLYWEWENIFEPWDFRKVEDFIRFRESWENVQSCDRKNLYALYEFFDIYRNYLRQKNTVDFGGALIEAQKFASKEPPLFRSVVVDEAQDMRPGTWILLRQLVAKQDNDIFIVGDPAQRIWSAYSELSRCGIDVEGRTERLRLNYRTTENVRSWACRILEGKYQDNLDGGFESQRGYSSERKGEPPLLKGFDTFEEEADFMGRKIQEFLVSGIALEDIVVIVRDEKNILPRYETALLNQGIPVFRIGKREIDDRTRKGIRMTIMHRVKGLEFENVFLVGVGEEHVPPRWLFDGKSRETQENLWDKERTLLYVSATRTKNRLVVTWNGKPSLLIKSLI